MEQPIISGNQFIYLILIISAMLLIGWIWFFYVVNKNNESVRDMLTGSSFLQNLTIIVVVATTGLLGITRILKGELVATLLGSIVGYVLGTSRRQDKPLQ